MPSTKPTGALWSRLALLRVWIRDQHLTCRRRRCALAPRVEGLEGRALLTAGVLDSSFGNGGLVTVADPPNPNWGFQGAVVATALYPQNDPGDPADAGKIVIAGRYNTGSKDDFGVLRLNPNGALDTSFGGTGVVVTAINSLNDGDFAVAIQPDGKVVVGGYASSTNGGSAFALARCNTNGTLDTTFGSGGLVTTQVSARNFTPYDGIHSLVVEPNGEILAGGNGTMVVGGNSASGFMLALYRANGQLDTSFGSKGTVLTSQGTGISYVGLQTLNGVTKIIAAGSFTSYPGVAVARYNLSGSLDTSFGTSGIATFSNMTLNAGAIQADGSILAAGNVGNGSPQLNMSLVRFTPGGSLDTTFAQGGEAVISFVSGTDKCNGNAVVVQPNGDIIEGGGDAVPIPNSTQSTVELALARFTPSGQLDTTFGAAGTGTVLTPVDSTPTDSGDICALGLQADGGIVAAGLSMFNTPSLQYLAARYLGDPAPTPAPTALSSRISVGFGSINPDPSPVPLVLSAPDPLIGLSGSDHRRKP